MVVGPGSDGGQGGYLYVGGTHLKDVDAAGEYADHSSEGDVLQLDLSGVSAGVVLESDHMTADIRPDHCGDLLGSTSVDVVDLDGDGFTELVAGSADHGSIADTSSCDQWPPEYNVGAWVVIGPFSGDVVAEEVGWFAGYRWDELSDGVTWNGFPVVVGDVTGDGQRDLALPLAGGSLGVPGGGEVALLPGPFEPGEHVDLSEHDLVFQGGAHPSVLAPTVADAFDADGDGVSDLVLAQAYSGPFPAVNIYLGPVDEATAAGEPDAMVGTPKTPWEEGLNYWDLYGYWGQPVINGGDMDGDGRDELVVSAFGRNVDLMVDPGLVWILGDPIGLGVSDIEQVASATIVGTSDFAFAGWPLAGGGDLDGDGHTDLVLGSSSRWSSSLYSPGNPNPGTWLHYGPLSGTLPHDQGAVVSSKGTYLVSAKGDLDGDGIDDLVMTDDTISGEDVYFDGMTRGMGDAVHVWLSGQSLEFPRPWAPNWD
ncbi:FG-GAP-like repeat-containing protein [Myxococcota bacterium]|nr:FG-GAP-like repeat-containing protein [Myxococcota bacterium]